MYIHAYLTYQYYYVGKETNTKTRDSDSGVMVAIVVSILVASGIVVAMGLLFIGILLQKR